MMHCFFIVELFTEICVWKLCFQGPDGDAGKPGSSGLPGIPGNDVSTICSIFYTFDVCCIVGHNEVNMHSTSLQVGGTTKCDPPTM